MILKLLDVPNYSRPPIYNICLIIIVFKQHGSYDNLKMLVIFLEFYARKTNADTRLENGYYPCVYYATTTRAMERNIKNT